MMIEFVNFLQKLFVFYFYQIQSMNWICKDFITDSITRSTTQFSYVPSLSLQIFWEKISGHSEVIAQRFLKSIKTIREKELWNRIQCGLSRGRRYWQICIIFLWQLKFFLLHYVFSYVSFEATTPTTTTPFGWLYTA